MIYLARVDGRIDACEKEESANRCEVRGCTRCSRALYMAHWKRNDLRALARMAWETAPFKARSVGGMSDEPTYHQFP